MKLIQLLGKLIYTNSRKSERNYLRVYGEYYQRSLTPLISLELPPRTRRIPNVLGRTGVITGTTSVRGEYLNELGFL